MRQSNARKKSTVNSHAQAKPQRKTSLSLKNVQPMTFTQARAFRAFDNEQHIALTGAPGTGKTFCALYLALRAVLDDNWFDKIIVLKSAKSTVDIGFLPGDMEEKIAIYEEPYIDNTNKLFERDDAYSILKQNGTIEFASTSFLRGLTFENAVVILDEFQNASAQECHTVASRLGENCRLIVMGDKFQTDFLKHDPSGFEAFIKVLRKIETVSVIEFGIDDIVRSGFVKEYMKAITG